MADFTIFQPAVPTFLFILLLALFASCAAEDSSSSTPQSSDDPEAIKSAFAIRKESEWSIDLQMSTPQYYVNWNILMCVQDCDGSPPCGGKWEVWRGHQYDSAEECCSKNLSFLPPEKCQLFDLSAQTSIPSLCPSSLLPPKYYVDWSSLKCVQDCDGPPPCGGKWEVWRGHRYDSAEECCNRNLLFIPMEQCKLAVQPPQKTLPPSTSVAPSSSNSIAPSTSSVPSSSTSYEPSLMLSAQPSSRLSSVPSSHPSLIPSSQPHPLLSAKPSLRTSGQPSNPPWTSHDPPSAPSVQPTESHTMDPTESPTFAPTLAPTLELENKDEELVSGSFHLAIVIDPNEIIYSDNMIDEMEEITLEYLKDNIGGENRFTPISVNMIDLASGSQEVGQGSNEFLLSTVMKINVTLAVKVTFIEWLNQQHQLQMRHLVSSRHLGVKICPNRDYFACCEHDAINKDAPSANCIAKGCTNKRCKRTWAKKEDKRKNKNKNNNRELHASTKSVRELLEEEDVDLSDKNFLDVIRKYTTVKPKQVRSILNATDTKQVASCSVNRYIDDTSETPSFSCDTYEVFDCAANEDIEIKPNATICQSPMPSNIPSSVPSISPTQSFSPTKSFSPTMSPTSLVSYLLRFSSQFI